MNVRTYLPKNRSARVFGLAGAVAMLATGVAQAQLPPGKWWREQRIQKELGLSQDQVAQLGQIEDRTRDQLIDLRAEVEKKSRAVEDVFDKEPFDEGGARSAQAAREQAMLEVFKAESARSISMRKVLTSEQFMKLGAFRPPMHGPGGPGGPGHGPGPGGPMGPGPGGPGPGMGGPGMGGPGMGGPGMGGQGQPEGQEPPDRGTE
ncbi:MAG: periplasmic heavy metal sensor [Acidobacteriota bacterium]